MKRSSVVPGSTVNVTETLNELARLERRGWWSFGTTVVIILILAAGLATLTLSSLREKMIASSQFDLVVRGLVPIVVLFIMYAVRQQAGITRLRRQLAIQVGMIVTTELLKPPSASEIEARQNRRKNPRFYFDQRIKVRAGNETIHGRTRDISETGIGVVIPRSLTIGSKVIVEFDSEELANRVVVCEVQLRHSHGFYHGFEFFNLNAANESKVKFICAALDAPVNVLAVNADGDV